MPLAIDDGLRFARHILLAEIGESGQAVLSEATVSLPEQSEFAVEYLRRAGVRVVRDGSHKLDLVRSGEFVTDAALAPSVDALLGALSAVECIKHLLHVGVALKTPLPRLSSQADPA